MTKININGVVRDMTSAEKKEHEKAHKILKAEKKILRDAKEVKATKKASAITKLKALGLTDAEIGALKI
tara:strand:- start:14 stop:220 length:207 start_codon:yes stop_codon:yes gene_type:complete